MRFKKILFLLFSRKSSRLLSLGVKVDIEIFLNGIVSLVVFKFEFFLKDILILGGY